MSFLLFGTAGIPLAAKGRDTVFGITAVRKLGLDAMELEFVHSVNISRENSGDVKAAALKEKIALSCHAPYFINLNAATADVLEASKKRLVHAAEIANLCGAKGIIFHPGFYLGNPKDKAYGKIRDALKDVVSQLKEINCKIWLRPETTGKRTQFGDLDELIKLSAEIGQMLPCIDYAHMHARESSSNSYNDFNDILVNVESVLGKEALQNMHIHMSGVNYSDKGELNHLVLQDADLNYQDIIRSWKNFRISGTVISESPNIEGDALLMKKEYF
jgi:deoxyribonuclease IV